MIKGLATLALGIWALLATSPARADYVVYTNRTTFEAALKSEQTETFNELGTSTQDFGTTGLSQTNGLVQPITVTGSNNTLYSTSSLSLIGYYASNGTFLTGPVSTTLTDGITVNLPTNTANGAGADVAIFASNSLVSFYGTTSQGEHLSGSVLVNALSSGSSFGFLGVMTISPTDYITSLTFSSPLGASQNILIDNFSFGPTPQLVPEPAAMALFATGALMFGAVSWRRRRHR